MIALALAVIAITRMPRPLPRAVLVGQKDQLRGRMMPGENLTPSRDCKGAVVTNHYLISRSSH